MAPPNTPGIPGLKLPHASQEVVARKRSNSHGDSDPPIEIEESAAEFATEVHANYGKGKFSGPAWVFLVVAALGAAVAITYFVTRNSDSSRPPNDDVLSELRAFRAEQDKNNIDTRMQIGFLTNRVGALETQASELRAAIAGISAAKPRFAPPVNVAVSNALTQHK